MDYEKKYKKALEWMREAYPTLQGAAKEDAEHYFPELAESEDEKMRKVTIEFVKQNKSFNWLLGISKEQVLAWLEKQGEQKDILENVVLDSNEDGLIADTIRCKIEKQGEQKPIVPEFRIGDIITPKGKKEYYTITDIVDGWYEFREKHVNGGIPIHYQFGWELVEQKPTEWSEKDETNLNDAIDACKAKYGNMSYTADWLKSLKDRALPQPKQEWSEKDERIKNNLLSELTNLSVRKLIEKETEKKYASWLKSLRPQSHWKPNDEQMELLERVFNGETNPKDVPSSLKNILEQLKKLKDEK